jgi:succinate dehydrogenase/fumarate reductase flavoprotein subunit
MKTKQIANQTVTIHNYNTVIVGAGAAGMNCAVRLYQFMEQKGVPDPQERIAVVTAGLPLGTSRMSGSDKQTYYKMGTSPQTPDSAKEFAKSLTVGGCCHGDLALAEAIGSLRGFYHLVEGGVPFPHDSLGSYIGYKTDHDPYERATSAGPKTSKIMSECLEKKVRRFGIHIHDKMEVAELLTQDDGAEKRIIGIVTIDKNKLEQNDYLNIFYCENLVLAAGGPGELYKTSVYPKGQFGIHGIALKAGLTAENLTESQYGLASTKFRWNVSGTYMQSIPRIFSTDADGRDEREFLTDFFPDINKMATNIFLKGYQWPFDPQRVNESSLIDLAVFNETQKGRRVFMDFMDNPVGSEAMKKFAIDHLEQEASTYLKSTGAIQQLPIERLAHMNPPAIEIYKEHGIDLYSEPLEIALCAQHNNGGFAVNKWWESSIPQTFIIGEMAGTHGVKRPGGSALNAGQVGAQRAAEYIVNVYGTEIANPTKTENQIERFIKRLEKTKNDLAPPEAITQIQHRMTAAAGHMRELSHAQQALSESHQLYNTIQNGLKLKSTNDIVTAIQAENLAITSIAYLKAIVELLQQGAGSRGSYLVLTQNGIQIHPDIINHTTGHTLQYKPENKDLRKSILQVKFDPDSPDPFTCKTIPVRPIPSKQKAFEPAWQDYREGKIYNTKSD